MLEATAGVCSQMKNERVIAIRYLPTHHLDLCLDNLLHVASHALGVVVTFSIDHDAVGNSFHVEYECLEVADFKR